MNEKTRVMQGGNEAVPSVQRPAPAKGGLLERAFTRLLMRPARVVGVEDIAPGFRLIDFQGDALKDCSWLPGQKVQVKLDGGFITRTYTPIFWDVGSGATQFLAYCHGSGPGSDWARTVAIGDERQFFGPRSSISTEGLASSSVVFGDETSFALALAIARTSGAADRRDYIFEVTDPGSAAHVLERLGLPAAVLVERKSEDAHLGEIAAALLRARRPGSDFILTGKASSIQYASRMLKGEGVTTRSLRTKAYWAPGKTGLD